jgi:cytochrome P450
VLDIANIVPALVTMEMLGLPLDDWEAIAEPTHAIACTPVDHPDRQRVEDDYVAIRPVLEHTIEERRRSPKDDIISYLVAARIDGEPIDYDDLVSTVHLLLTGGIDTTTALFGSAIDYLDRNRAARQFLLDDLGRIQFACEEFLRYFPPAHGLARTATRDVEVGGQLIPAGDRVLLCWAGANWDPEVFQDPDEIVLDRFPNRHAAFGIGAHRCIGSNFARADFGIMLEQVLRRTPDYQLVRDDVEKYESIGVTNGWAKMPGRFTPGTRITDRDHFPPM